MSLDFYKYYQSCDEEQEKRRRRKISSNLKKKRSKKRKRKKAMKVCRPIVHKSWDSSLTNLNTYKLSNKEQIAKKLSSVSKHRHYAKDLIAEQKRRYLEHKRLKSQEDQRNINEQEMRRNRSRQLLLPFHNKANEETSEEEYQSMESEFSEIDDESRDMANAVMLNDDGKEEDDYKNNKSENIKNKERKIGLKELRKKVESLEKELKQVQLFALENEESESNVRNAITFEAETIINHPPHLQQTKNSNIMQISFPELTCYPSNNEKHKQKKSNIILNEVKPQIELENENKAILNKLEKYFADAENEKRDNEEFRSSLLEAINAQNIQILHLLSQMSQQSKEISHLKNEVKELKDAQRISSISSLSQPALPQWTSYSNKDWQSMAAVLPQKNHCFIPIESENVSHPYTIESFHSCRSFLPTERSTAPLPHPKNELQENENEEVLVQNQDIIINKHNLYVPQIRVERC